MVILHTFLARRNNDYIDPSQKGETSQRYGPFSKRRNKSKIWTLLKNEKHVEDMDPSQKVEIG